jgi:hypothetical protein
MVSFTKTICEGHMVNPKRRYHEKLLPAIDKSPAASRIKRTYPAMLHTIRPPIGGLLQSAAEQNARTTAAGVFSASPP